MDKGSNETINKRYAEYKQRELNEKGEKTGKALGKRAVSLYSAGISWVVESEMLKNCRKILKMTGSLKIRWLT